MSKIFDFRMVGKLRESALLFYENLGLFLAIVLSVSIPASLLGSLIEFLFAVDEFYLLNFYAQIVIFLISNAIYASALIYTLARHRNGQGVEYGEAIGAGLHFFGRLFIARLVAGFIVAFGLILLLVPGTYLAVRYSLLDFLVVLEGASASESRKQSAQLTEGFWWPIFWVFPSFSVLGIVFLFLLFLLILPITFFGGDESLIVNVIFGCGSDVLHAILTIALFLIYSERMGLAQTGTDELDPSATAP